MPLSAVPNCVRCRQYFPRKHRCTRSRHKSPYLYVLFLLTYSVHFIVSLIMYMSRRIQAFCAVKLPCSVTLQTVYIGSTLTGHVLHVYHIYVCYFRTKFPNKIQTVTCALPLAPLFRPHKALLMTFNLVLLLACLDTHTLRTVLIPCFVHTMPIKVTI
jgi:hypothetical protein